MSFRFDFSHIGDGALRAARNLGILGEHDLLITALVRATRVAPLGAPVLLLGETGTGKELFARFIHELSVRREEEMLALNCAAIPANLIESELFGHEKGAFTGAQGCHIGAFERAKQGTLFLDELGEMSSDQQAKLLRAVQEGVIQRVGGKEQIKVRPRFIAATNIDLAVAIREKRFRADLYYRFRCLIQLPALRHRASDIPILVNALLQRCLKSNGKLPDSQRFSPTAVQLLQRQLWPGNIRQLERVVEMSSMEASGKVIEPAGVVLDDLELSDESEFTVPEPHEGFEMRVFLSGIRRRLILRAIEKSGGNLAAAARLLGCSRQVLSQEMAQEKLTDDNQTLQKSQVS